MKPSRDDYFAIYTLLTRVEHGDHFRIICLGDDMLTFVDNLHPPDDLLAFMDGYDANGTWVQKVAMKSSQDRIYRRYGSPEIKINKAKKLLNRKSNL